MATTTTESYSPFQQELLNHLGQISTNVNTLIEVFVNLQSSLLIQSNNNQSISSPTTNSTKLIHTKSNNDNNDNNNNNNMSPTRSSPSRSMQSSIIINDKDDNNILKLNDSTDLSSANNVIIEETNVDNSNKDGNDEKKDGDDDGNDEIVLSLDSSDTDDETNGSLNDLNGGNHASHSSSHLSYIHNNNNNKYKYNNHNNSSWKHRSKFSLNRSKSTSSPSASMSTLLRANHIRNHKYSGILKNKYKKKGSSYDQKSDSVINKTGNNKRNNHHLKHIKTKTGPQFNPEHVYLGKNNRITINVGGSSYETTLNTLSADQSSMLSAMFSGRFNIEKDKNGSIFIDRDPTHFRQFCCFYNYLHYD